MILRNLKNQPFNIPLGGGTVRLGPMEAIEISDADAELPIVQSMVRMRNVALKTSGGATPAKPKKKSSRKGSKKKAEDGSKEAPPAAEPQAASEDSVPDLERERSQTPAADQYDEGNSF